MSEHIVSTTDLKNIEVGAAFEPVDDFNNPIHERNVYMRLGLSDVSLDNGQETIETNIFCYNFTTDKIVIFPEDMEVFEIEYSYRFILPMGKDTEEVELIYESNKM